MLKHNSYKAAKSGSLPEARKLVADIFPNLGMFSHLEGYACPVMKLSGNRIPFALAERLSQFSKLVLNTCILLNHSAHGTYMVDRIYYQPEFHGIIKPGNYVICDDVYTSGKTIISLKNYIESHGGSVTRVITIGSSASTCFQPDRLLLKILYARFPEIERYFDIDFLTTPQILYILRHQTIHSLENSYYKSMARMLYSA
jgi:hypothetical protein